MSDAPHVDGFGEARDSDLDGVGNESAPREVRFRPDGHDGQLLTTVEGGEPKGFAHVTDRELRELRVARDGEAHQRGLELVERARADGEPLVAVPRSGDRTPAPDHIDLLDLDEREAQRFWGETVPSDLAWLDSLRDPAFHPPEQRHDLPALTDVDDRHPGLYARAETREPTTTDPLESPGGWVEQRNPDFATDPRRWHNCGDCARATELRWRGIDAEAAPKIGDETNAVMDEWSQGDRVPASFEGIGDTLRELGPGASAIVGVDWHDGGGHWFNTVNDGGVITAADGQTGGYERWPPSPQGLGFDERDARTVDAIFVDAHGNHLTAADLGDRR